MPEAATAPPTLDKKKSIILGLLGLAVVVLIFVRVIPQIGSYKDAITALESMSAGAVACIVLAVLVYLLAYGLPFMAATPGLTYWRSQQLNQGAFAISNGVPAGGAFGLGVQYAMLASYGVGPTVSTAAITAVGVWSIFVTLGLPILGVAAIQLSGQAALHAQAPELHQRFQPFPPYSRRAQLSNQWQHQAGIITGHLPAQSKAGHAVEGLARHGSFSGPDIPKGRQRGFGVQVEVHGDVSAGFAGPAMHETGRDESDLARMNIHAAAIGS